MKGIYLLEVGGARVISTAMEVSRKKNENLVSNLLFRGLNHPLDWLFWQIFQVF